MKNLGKSLLVAGAMLCTVQSFAQSGIKRTANKVGHKTSQIASKGASAVMDKKYKGKCGPQGQTVYIDKNSKYYYVNSRGRHAYLAKWQLKNSHDMKM